MYRMITTLAGASSLAALAHFSIYLLNTAYKAGGMQGFALSCFAIALAWFGGSVVLVGYARASMQ